MRLRGYCIGLALSLASGSTLLPPPTAAQPIDWVRYRVPETGAAVDVPSSIFTEEAGSPEAGHGKRFVTSDRRADLTMQSVANDAGLSPAAFLAQKNPPPNIVYKKVTAQFFVVSSFRQGKIWYDRCNFAGRSIHCVLINYPAQEKREWDGIVTRISNTLS